MNSTLLPHDSEEMPSQYRIIIDIKINVYSTIFL